MDEYLQYLKGLGYTQASIKQIRMHLIWFIEMFSDETQWNDLALKAFMDKRGELFTRRKGRGLKKSYLGVLERDIRRFLHYLGKKEPQEGPLAPPASWWARQLDEYLNYCSHHQGLGKAAIWKRRYFLRGFIHWLERHSVMSGKALSFVLIMKFVRQNAKGYSLSKVKGLNAALRGFLFYLYQQDEIERDISCAIMSPRQYREQRIPPYLTDSQLQTLLNSFDTESAQDFRDYCIFILLIQYGLRIAELSGLTLHDIDWRERTLLIRDRKAQGHLLLPLSETVASDLERYISLFRPDSKSPRLLLCMRAPLRPLSRKYMSTLICRRFDKAGIKGYAHLLRHTFAKNLIEQGEPLCVIQKLLGHRDISTTRIYAKVNIEQLREVAENDSVDIVTLA